MARDEELREAAIARLEARRAFRSHAAVYVIVNAMLVAIWALSDVSYFWPVWTILGWGVGLAFHAWSVFVERPITEEEISAEMRRDGTPPSSD